MSSPNSKDDVNDYAQDNHEDLVESLYQAEEPAVEAMVQWALGNNPELLCKVVGYAEKYCPDKIRQAFLDAVTQEAVDALSNRPYPEPEDVEER
jgi:hypothetical protein